MSKTLIYLCAIFGLWFYLYLSSNNTKQKRGSGFSVEGADKAQSGNAVSRVNFRGSGFEGGTF